MQPCPRKKNGFPCNDVEKCRVCRLYHTSPEHKAAWDAIPAPAEVTAKAGTVLKKMLAELGLEASEGKCQCNNRAAMMDAKGPQWCREHREEIIRWLKEEAAKRTWSNVLKAAVMSMKPGVFQPNITDPFGSLIDEAIRRSEVTE